MKPEIIQTVAAVCRSAGGPVLLIDSLPALREALDKAKVEHGSLASMDLVPEDLWYLSGGRTFASVVIGRPRTARELFRILHNVERLVMTGGTVLIAPYVTEDGPENRFEATEIFSALFQDWDRKLIPYGVVEMTKTGVAATGQIDVVAPGYKKVIGLSIFNAGSTYWKYLPAYVRAHHTLFSDFELRIHHDESLYQESYGTALAAMEALGLVKLVLVSSLPDTGKCQKMLWRTMPAWDPTVKYVFCRDVDSLPTWRDRCAVEEFIASGRDAHVIHDNVMHEGILGGLCGLRGATMRRLFVSFDEFVKKAGKLDAQWAEHGADQDWLNEVILGGGIVQYRMQGTPTKIPLMEHSLFRYTNEAGDRTFRNVVDGVLVKNDVDRFAAESTLSLETRSQTDALINYMGAAGYDLDRAMVFYSKHCPVIDKITEAEKAAGVA